MSVRAYIKIRACPKCGGDIMVDRALEDSDVCIQCGFRSYPKPAPPLPQRKRRRRKTEKVEETTSQEIMV